MSLRARLTIWYVGLLAIILIAFALVIYTLQQRSALGEVDAELQTYTRALISVASRDLLIKYVNGTAPDMTPRGEVVPTFTGSQLFVQFSDLFGQLGTQSPKLRDEHIPLDDEMREWANQGRATKRTVELPNGTLLRVYTEPVIVDNLVIGYIQVARTINAVADSLKRLATLLVVGIGLALALAGLVGVLLAEAALRPIDSVTQTALRITQTDDLSRRIQLPPSAPQDEVGRLASTFNLMLDRIEILFETQQRFIADVSHELRTPLTTIRGNLALIKRSGEVDPDSLAAMEGEADRMARLVRDLLLLAQADAGVTLQRSTVELDSLLLEVYRQTRIIAQQTGSGVTVRLGAEDQATVQGDADRLRQLLLNLAENAVKYTPPGGHVTLGLVRQDGWVKVTVSDTGIGIPAEDVPHIFERFYRVDKARSREKGGTGLGLSIAQWIAQAHGGRLDVASLVGQGTTFALSLPTVAGTPAPTARELAATHS